MFITLAAPLGSLGLAVPGWGGLAAFLSHPALICPGDRTLRAILHSQTSAAEI